jgi:hypothetical protein
MTFATTLDAEKMLYLLAGLEAALVLHAEHDERATVLDFVRDSAEFRAVADFLHAAQHHKRLAITFPKLRGEA